MASMFTESPWLLILIGLLGAAFFLSRYIRDREPLMLVGLGGCLLFALIPFVISIMVETTGEQIRRTVREMAGRVSQNDMDGLLSYVDPSATEVIRKIKREMPNLDFTMCTVTGFESIEPHEHKQGEIEVHFDVFVNVSAPAFGHEGVAPRGVTLVFRRQPGTQNWKVIGYSHYPSHMLDGIR